MKIKLERIRIGDVFDGFANNKDTGEVLGYKGQLNIRPKYQREFVYERPQEESVINTIIKGFPLNLMYWSKNSDGSLEILDGQQRTMSFCRFMENRFSISINGKTMIFSSLPKDQRDKILDYELMVYICEGTESEKLEWFEIINIAGMKLTPQELRNAVYTGEWLSDAKRYFSKLNHGASGASKDYVEAKVNRQGLLEIALQWMVNSKEPNDIAEYMARHQLDTDADELRQHFNKVIDWVKNIFRDHKHKDMKNVDWGTLYNKHKDDTYNSPKILADLKKLYNDDEVTSHTGIYYYLIDDKDVRYLSLRTFPAKIKERVYLKQNGICPHCKQQFPITKMEADHIDPWHSGGKTDEANCQMLCKPCNRRKSGK